MRFRQEMAVSVVQELLRYRDVAGLAMEVLNSKIRFLEKPTDSMTTRKRLYPTYQAWAELMKDIGKVKLTMQPQKKSLTKGVGVVGKVCCSVFETVCRGWKDRAERLYR